MATIQGVRERARAEITEEILTVARRHLATDGAAGLSLRAVARELGMVSSGIYRYVASRDELLTRLIVEAYDALGAVAEDAARASARRAPAQRWVVTGAAIRAWALERPQEYALLYGTPVPGYVAPADTIAPAARVTMALIGIVADARRAGRLQEVPPVEVPVAVRADAARLREEGIDLPADVLVRVVAAWTQLFGLVTFELFGQTHGAITAHAELFDATTRAMATFVGLG